MKPTENVSLPKIHSLSKILIKRNPSLSSLHKNENLRTPSLSKGKGSLHSYRDVSGSVRVSTPEIKKKMEFLAESDWKYKEKMRLKEQMRERSLLSFLEKSFNGSEKSRDFTIPPQHRIDKFYLEYHQSYHSQREKVITKQEISDLLGIKDFDLNKEDTQLKQIIDNYPNASFLDLSLLKIQDLDEKANSTLANKFRKVLMKGQSSSLNQGFADFLQDFQHKSQSNPEKNPTKRNAIYELAHFLDKISQEIFEKNPSNEDFSLEKKVFLMKNACKVCIQNLAKEISQECIERGLLLTKIWDLNIEFGDLLIKKYQSQYQEIEKSFIKNLHELKSIYQDKFTNLISENDNLKSRLNNITQEMIEKTSEIEFYKEKTNYSEKLRKLQESEFDELVSNYEHVFQDNLRLRIQKADDSGIQKQEKEILKRGLDEMIKLQTRREKMGHKTSNPITNPMKLEGVFLKLNSGELNSLERKETTNKFMMQMTNLTFNILDFPRKLDDLISKENPSPSNLQANKNLFVKDQEVDTIDLVTFNEKSIGTSDFKCYLEGTLEKEVQTVLYDEITDEGLIMRPLTESMIGSELIYQTKKANLKGEINLFTPGKLTILRQPSSLSIRFFYIFICFL